MREHVYLIDNIYTVFADLRRHPYHIGKGSDIFNLVVGGSIQLMDIQ
jgi:hypothetical protein